MIALCGYTAYFDASVDSQTVDNETIVAGYVSSVEEWSQWEMAWRLILAEFDVPYFHMKEFAAHQKAFKSPKWKSESYRKAFISKLITATCGWTVACIGSGVKQTVFDFQNAFFQLDTRFNPYVISARDCAMHTKKFIREEYKSDLPITYIFERGDSGAGMLMKEMELSGLPSPVFKRPRPDPKLDKDDPPAIQLQACDLIAWEIRRASKDFHVGKELRKSLRALAGIKHRKWMHYQQSDLSRLIQVAGVPLRPAWSHLRSAESVMQFQKQIKKP